MEGQQWQMSGCREECAFAVGMRYADRKGSRCILYRPILAMVGKGFAQPLTEMIVAGVGGDLEGHLHGHPGQRRIPCRAADADIAMLDRTLGTGRRPRLARTDNDVDIDVAD